VEADLDRRVVDLEKPDAVRRQEDDAVPGLQPELTKAAGVAVGDAREFAETHLATARLDHRDTVRLGLGDPVDTGHVLPGPRVEDSGVGGDGGCGCAHAPTLERVLASVEALPSTDPL